MTRVNVVDKLELMVFDGQGTEAGKSSTYYLELNAFNTEPVTITLESDDPDVASVPAVGRDPAGAQMASVMVKGVSEGTATLKATYGDDRAHASPSTSSPHLPRSVVLERARCRARARSELGALSRTLDARG